MTFIFCYDVESVFKRAMAAGTTDGLFDYLKTLSVCCSLVKDKLEKSKCQVVWVFFPLDTFVGDQS